MIDKLIIPNYDVEDLVNSNSNFKSKIIEWAQREGKEVRFEIVNVKKKAAITKNSLHKFS